MPAPARFSALALLVVFVACESASNPAQPASEVFDQATAGEAVPGQYIVVFQNSVADPASVATELVNTAGGSLLHVYTSAIKGFAARLPAPAADALGGL